MPGLFDWLENISSGKAIEIGSDGYREYVPFQINNGLSQNLDTVLLANEMNKRPWLSKEMQHKFYVHTVNKKKRFGKWGKAEVLDNQQDIDTVSEYYDVNKEIASTYIKMLTPEHIAYMKKMNDKGGADTKIAKGKK